MRALSASHLVRVWERGEGRDCVEQALLLLGAVLPDKTPEELAELSIGERDTRLFELRQRIFRGALEGFAQCPNCATSVEYSLLPENLPNERPLRRGPLLLESGEFSLRLRPPNSLDLQAARRCKDMEEARRLVAHRCVLEAARNGAAIAAEELPESLIGELSECLAQADPQAELLIDLTCPECQHGWQLVFEISRHLWTEMRVLAKQILMEVHTLAWAYGWREADILAMSATRRRSYLEMVG